MDSSWTNLSYMDKFVPNQFLYTYRCYKYAWHAVADITSIFLAVPVYIKKVCQSYLSTLLYCPMWEWGDCLCMCKVI